MRAIAIVVAATGLLLGALSSGLAASREFQGTNGSNLKAEALFELQGTDLTVTLKNTSQADVLNNPEILTAVFFDITTDPMLTKGSAILSPGSVVRNPPSSVPSPHPSNVGGEWGYERANGSGGLGLGVAQRYGISAAGFGVGGTDMFGPTSLFSTNLHGTPSPGGLDYGLTSAGDNPTTGTGHVGGSQAWPLIQNSVVFSFQIDPVVFTIDDVKNIRFQYGTDLGTGDYLIGSEVPEPGTWGMLALAASSLVARRRRRRTA
jgi:hypothetical protein